jgi:hypothetical protein
MLPLLEARAVQHGPRYPGPTWTQGYIYAHIYAGHTVVGMVLGQLEVLVDESQRRSKQGFTASSACALVEFCYPISSEHSLRRMVSPTGGKIGLQIMLLTHCNGLFW